MNQIIAYTLNSNNTLGCFPECVVLDMDEDNKPSTSFVKLSRHNIQRYRNLIDSHDDVLINCCFRLEKDTIVSKITDKNVNSWEDLLKKYFDGKNNHQDIQFIRDYISDYINQYLNTFFGNIGDKRLYLAIGKFPFMWKALYVQLEMPELFYCFDKKEDGLYFSLDLSCENRKFELNTATLVSRKRARILLDNKI